MKMNLQRILVKGGVLSPSELKQIIEMAELMGLDSIHLGSRQDIIFPKAEKAVDVQEQFPGLTLEYVKDRKFQNIVSSYVSADISPSTPWLSGAVYLNILEQFNEDSRIEINLTDPLQPLVPLFSGNLNFIASEEEDYWYLYLRFDHWSQIHCYPVLIFSWDIARVAQTIEGLYEDASDAQSLFEMVNQILDANNRTLSGPLKLPFQTFPYYEGMNKMSIDQYWLGLYWRNNRYDLKFLKAMCDLSLEGKIGKICLTPWKSLVVKGISRQQKLAWEKLLGRFGINVRHSSLELNWHLPLADEEALELKRYIVRNFDQNDISTYGLTFSIRSDYGVNFTSIVIEKNPIPSIVRQYQIRPTYNVLYCEDFNPNRQQYITYAQDVDKIELPGLLMELSQLYFEQLGETSEVEPEIQDGIVTSSTQVEIDDYQCLDCHTIYDSRYGDIEQSIPVGMPFEQLPDTYVCPVCEAPKDRYRSRRLQSSDFAEIVE
ncbi:rubredoxin domain-containing protein [Pontibacter sp. G13]|uniref:rubredoxin domain-containing protein n=1 Tax=Pontibacter sp. G13 TaxID=3074898 RepID=UPI00288C4C17|nr:rubredoxin domain-containing protein [Pontibacter sp. G13]WNJ17850.1 rubredoxin domain-containing protein [Pontibacter sp. G13]